MIAVNLSAIELEDATGDQRTHGQATTMLTFNGMLIGFVCIMSCFCMFVWFGKRNGQVIHDRGDRRRRLNDQARQHQPIQRSATPEMLEALRVETFQKPAVDNPERDDSCSICLCDYEENEEIRVLRCHHRFHKECIDCWLRNSVKCPICKRDIDTTEVIRERSSSNFLDSDEHSENSPYSNGESSNDQISLTIGGPFDNNVSTNEEPV